MQQVQCICNCTCGSIGGQKRAAVCSPGIDMTEVRDAEKVIHQTIERENFTAECIDDVENHSFLDMLPPSTLNALDFVIFDDPSKKYQLRRRMQNLGVKDAANLDLDSRSTGVKLIDYEHIDNLRLSENQPLRVQVRRFTSLDKVEMTPLSQELTLRQLYISKKIKEYEKGHKLLRVSTAAYHPVEGEIYLVQWRPWNEIQEHLEGNLGKYFVRRLENNGKIAKVQWDESENKYVHQWFRASCRGWSNNPTRGTKEPCVMFWLLDLGRFIIVPRTHVRWCPPRFLLHYFLTFSLSLTNVSGQNFPKFTNTLFKRILCPGSRHTVIPQDCLIDRTTQTLKAKLDVSIFNANRFKEAHKILEKEYSENYVEKAKRMIDQVVADRKPDSDIDQNLSGKLKLLKNCYAVSLNHAKNTLNKMRKSVSSSSQLDLDEEISSVFYHFNDDWNEKEDEEEED